MNQTAWLRSTLLGGVGLMIGLLPVVMRPAQAQEPQCPGSSNVEIKYCLRLEYEAADRDLNAAYKRVIKQLEPEQKDLLIDAQVAWIK